MSIQQLRGVCTPQSRSVARQARRVAVLTIPIFAVICGAAGADPACDTELELIRATLTEPPASVSSEGLQQADAMANVLAADCEGGSSLESVVSLADAIRALLDMGERS